MSLCTALAVALPSELPGEARVLLAGHPPPLLVRDGVVVPVGTHGPMLGAVEVADWTVESVQLAPNDVLVLYTDGVLDAALPGGEHFGEDRLHTLVHHAGADVEAIAGALEGVLPGLRLRDDIALLAIRCPGPPALLARGTLDGDAERLLELELAGGRGRARRRAPGAARDGRQRVGDALESDALIVVSELVTNAIRHGGARTVGEAVRLDAALMEGLLRIEVDRSGRRASSRAATARAPTAATACTCSTGSPRGGAWPAPRRSRSGSSCRARRRGASSTRSSRSATIRAVAPQTRWPSTS